MSANQGGNMIDYNDDCETELQAERGMCLRDDCGKVSVLNVGGSNNRRLEQADIAVLVEAIRADPSASDCAGKLNLVGRAWINMQLTEPHGGPCAAAELEATIRVAIVEDEPLLREGLRALTGSRRGFVMVAVFGSIEEAERDLPGPSPQVMIIDVGLTGRSRIEAVRRFRAINDFIQESILTAHAEDNILFEAVDEGSCGCLPNATLPSRLLDAVRELASGGLSTSPKIVRNVVTMIQQAPSPSALQYLSSREHEILSLLAGGHSYKTSASTLGLSVDTVRFHLRKIYQKLHVHSKSEAVVKALRLGLIR
jgi:DNA-binding NarL/FixJ family response regulator